MILRSRFFSSISILYLEADVDFDRTNPYSPQPILLVGFAYISKTSMGDKFLIR